MSDCLIFFISPTNMAGRKVLHGKRFLSFYEDEKLKLKHSDVFSETT